MSEDRFRLIEGRLSLVDKQMAEMRTVLNVLGEWAIVNAEFLGRRLGVKEQPKPENNPVIPPETLPPTSTAPTA